MARVAVTGAGAICALGSSGADVLARLRGKRSAVQSMAQWRDYRGLDATAGAPVTDFHAPLHYKRRQTRSMGRVALMSVRAAELALEDAGLLGAEILGSGDTGVAFGSSMGSVDAVHELAHLLINKTTDRLNATSYVRMMSHTAAVNVEVFFGLTGRVLPTSSACTSGSQGIGYAYEAIRDGRQRIMIAGGADELCPMAAAVFDAAGAARRRDELPLKSPRPFDRDRDGPVLGEGACALILEDYEHASARGASILCELVGFGTNSDGKNLTEPTAPTLKRCIELALDDAGVSPADIGYVAACGLATEAADVAESRALSDALGDKVPTGALKSFLGHTLAASGALEAWIAVTMMNEDWFAPTLNLDRVNPRCAHLDYVRDEGRSAAVEFVMSNAFAFGGINTSLIFRRTRPH